MIFFKQSSFLTFCLYCVIIRFCTDPKWRPQRSPCSLSTWTLADQVRSNRAVLLACCSSPSQGSMKRRISPFLPHCFPIQCSCFPSFPVTVLLKRSTLSFQASVPSVSNTLQRTEFYFPETLGPTPTDLYNLPCNIPILPVGKPDGSYRLMKQ